LTGDTVAGIPRQPLNINDNKIANMGFIY